MAVAGVGRAADSAGCSRPGYWCPDGVLVVPVVEVVAPGPPSPGIELTNLLMLNLRASSTTESPMSPPLTGIGGNGIAHTLANESNGCPCPVVADAEPVWPEVVDEPCCPDCACAICARVSCAINASPTLIAERAR